MNRALIIVVIFILDMNTSYAQSDDTNAVGLGGDNFVEDTATLVGPSAKYFLEKAHAVQGEVMFESDLTTITALYEYHGNISIATGLKWFAGVGPSFLVYGDGYGTEIAIRPIAGLDYKINGIPLALSLDWRPFLGFGSFLGNYAGAFGVGIRYVIK